jgi:hypothetical protein
MKKHPDPEVFARIVLSKLARLQAEVSALRLRLYENMSSVPGWEMTFDEMKKEDEKNIQAFYRSTLDQSLNQCGLSPDPRPPDRDGA